MQGVAPHHAQLAFLNSLTGLAEEVVQSEHQMQVTKQPGSCS